MTKIIVAYGLDTPTEEYTLKNYKGFSKYEENETAKAASMAARLKENGYKVKTYKINIEEI